MLETLIAWRSQCVDWTATFTSLLSSIVNYVLGWPSRKTATLSPPSLWWNFPRFSSIRWCLNWPLFTDRCALDLSVCLFVNFPAYRFLTTITSPFPPLGFSRCPGPLQICQFFDVSFLACRLPGLFRWYFSCFAKTFASSSFSAFMFIGSPDLIVAFHGPTPAMSSTVVLPSSASASVSVPSRAFTFSESATYSPRVPGPFRHTVSDRFPTQWPHFVWT